MKVKTSNDHPMFHFSVHLSGAVWKNCTMVSPIPMAFLNLSHHGTAINSKSLRHWHRHRRCHPRFSTTFASATRPRCKGRLPGYYSPPAPSVRWSCETRLLDNEKGARCWGKSWNIWIHWWSSSPCETKEVIKSWGFSPFSTESHMKNGSLGRTGENVAEVPEMKEQVHTKYCEHVWNDEESRSRPVGPIKNDVIGQHQVVDVSSHSLF